MILSSSPNLITVLYIIDCNPVKSCVASLVFHYNLPYLIKPTLFVVRFIRDALWLPREWLKVTFIDNYLFNQWMTCKFYWECARFEHILNIQVDHAFTFRCFTPGVWWLKLDRHRTNPNLPLSVERVIDWHLSRMQHLELRSFRHGPLPLL